MKCTHCSHHNEDMEHHHSKRSGQGSRPMYSSSYAPTKTVLAFLVALYSSTSVSAFAPSATLAPPLDNITTKNLDFSNYPSVPFNDQMPIWLRPSGDRAEEELTKLRESMIGSYFSHSEAQTVISAIQEASLGDLNMMTGAAEFCSLLVETMEMGVNTLTAAAFHFCDCYVARQNSSRLQPAFSSSEYWSQIKSHEHNERCVKFGHTADRIAKCTASLKQTEMTAEQSLKSKPSRQDYETIRNMLHSKTKDWRALAIRSAGCLYRLRGINKNRDESQTTTTTTKSNEMRVAHEALSIYAPLASRMGMHRLKNEIESAAFRVLYPRQYEMVTSLASEETTCHGEDGYVTSSLNEDMALILDRIKDELEHFLSNDPFFLQKADSFTVSARIKEPYSLWRKMLKMKANQVLDVPDAIALRIVLQSKKMSPEEDAKVTSGFDRALCYYTLLVCTNIFKPLKDGRFKDYIESPKPNGYQSLHYTASTNFDGREWPFEIQIRSNEMHQVAEFGLAAHFDYKEHSRSDSSNKRNESTSQTHHAFHQDQSSDAYIRNVRNWHWQNGKRSWETDSVSRNGIERKKVSNKADRKLVKSERQRARNERLAPYLKALMADQSNLTREQVFIFLQNQEEEDGVTLALPAGSCIFDAIRESERTLGFTTSRNFGKKVEHNGSLASVTSKLNNGDILTIPYKI